MIPTFVSTVLDMIMDSHPDKRVDIHVDPKGKHVIVNVSWEDGDRYKSVGHAYSFAEIDSSKLSFDDMAEVLLEKIRLK
jgi:hypothetical protein